MVSPKPTVAIAFVEGLSLRFHSARVLQTSFCWCRVFMLMPLSRAFIQPMSTASKSTHPLSRILRGGIDSISCELRESGFTFLIGIRKLRAPCCEPHLVCAQLLAFLRKHALYFVGLRIMTRGQACTIAFLWRSSALANDPPRAWRSSAVIARLTVGMSRLKRC
jgi:hypothetical protein